MSRRKGSLSDQPSALQNAHYPPSNADYHNQHHYQNQFQNAPYPTDQVHQQSSRQTSNDNTNQHRLRALSAQPPQSLHKFNASIGGTTQEIEQIMALREELGKLHRPLFDGIQGQRKTQKTWREEGRNIMEEAANQSHFNRYKQSEQKKCNKWVEESLANEFASSQNYQEEFQDFKDEGEQLLLWEEPGRVNYSLARTQCRKIGKTPPIQHTFENIKQIIQRQQIEMKEYLEQRTTDTTDDQNISSNLNNKSSSEEALAGDSTFKFEYANIGDQLQGSFILGGFKLNKSAQKVSQTRELLSTSHDTTKLYDDEPPPPRHENHKGINNTFNFTHPIKSQPQQKHNFASAQKNSESVYKPQKKKLSIVSDFKLEELLKEQVKDPQLCPKRSDHLTNQVFLSSTQREKRSHSHPNRLEFCANKVQKQS